MSSSCLIRTMVASRMRFTLSILALVASCLMGCGREGLRATSDPPPIEIKATVQPAQSMTITAPIDGQVKSIDAREGAAVNADQPLVQLTNPAVERDAALARAQLDWIESRLRRGSRSGPPTPTQPRDSLEITAKILELRQQRFETMKGLRRTNDITARELEQAEIEYLTALRDYNGERGLPGASPGRADDRELLGIERKRGLAEERFAVERQALLRVVSPISGIVTRVHVTQGQAIFPRDPIADVSNVATLHVRGDVAPELLKYVRPGAQVTVKVFCVPPRTFAEEIEYVVPVQGADSASRAATVVVTIPNPDGSLQPNTPALITLRSLQ